MRRLPAISLWQPHASLLLTAPRTKRHETRHWRMPNRYIGQRALIHAAKTDEGLRDMDPELEALCLEIFGAPVRSLPRGGFIGTTVFRESFRMGPSRPRYGAADQVDELCGNWQPGRWAWPSTDPVTFAEPIPARGQQGWWTAEIEEQL